MAILCEAMRGEVRLKLALERARERIMSARDEANENGRSCAAARDRDGTWYNDGKTAGLDLALRILDEETAR